MATANKIYKMSNIVFSIGKERGMATVSTQKK